MMNKGLDILLELINNTTGFNILSSQGSYNSCLKPLGSYNPAMQQDR